MPNATATRNVWFAEDLRQYGLTPHDVNTDLDGYVPMDAAAVRSGRWNAGDVRAVDAARTARFNRVALAKIGLV
jgi:hypothetical protein